MSFLCDLAILGNPTKLQASELEAAIIEITEVMGLKLGKNIKWQLCPNTYTPDLRRSCAVIYFGATQQDESLQELLRHKIPILPVVTDHNNVTTELPRELQPFNCLSYEHHGPRRIATALLECAHLLPRQRKVFLSYRRDESREVALQLFDTLSEKLFDVFLDTHAIAPAEDFQARLWHKLCDSDVLIMLDTEEYFESRWTQAEFGRALAKDISVLRVGWPGVPLSPHAALAESLPLIDADFSGAILSGSAKAKVCDSVERLRSKSYAVRSRILFDRLSISLAKIGGQIHGTGMNGGIYLELPNRNKLVAYPSIGIPTSITLHQAMLNSEEYGLKSTAIVFDRAGIDDEWLAHLDWLHDKIDFPIGLLDIKEAAWQLADWQVKQ